MIIVSSLQIFLTLSVTLLHLSCRNCPLGLA